MSTTEAAQGVLIFVRQDRETGAVIPSSAVCSAHYYLSRGPAGVANALPHYGPEELACVACAEGVEK